MGHLKGFFGKFLDVNLSSGNIGDYEIPEEWYEKYLGGRGLGARILLEEMEDGVDPLGPGNLLIFVTGPLQGTGVPAAGRNAVMAKSPKTGSVSDSYVGGFFPHELGTSSYDGIIIRGRADSPKYLTLIDGKAGIGHAADLWGMETGDVDEELKERHGGGRTCVIGIAGENLVQFACIINDRNRAAGRPGFGAVMGSKNLKGILVKGGTGRPVYDGEKFKRSRSEFVRHLQNSSNMDWGKYGTTGGLTVLNERGILPTKNFQKGVFDGAGEISGERMYDEILTERDTCTGCPVRCKRVVKTAFAGTEVKERYGGPEYETLAAFGSCCMNDDLDAIALANQKCNAYGLDTISTGNTIAFAMEASERGLIDEDIKWGNPETVVELVDDIAHREGIGDWLGQGIDKVAEEIEADFAVVSKGQEVPMHDPRGKVGLGISYSATPRGGTHTEGFHDDFFDPTPDIEVNELSDRFSFEGKPQAVKNFEDLRSFYDSLILCILAINNSGEDHSAPFVRSIVNAITGFDIDAGEMLRIGERNFNLLKLHAAREGYSRENDRLPGRLKGPLPRGASADNPIPEKRMQKALDDYYEVRGWNKKGPTEEKLKELGMEELIGKITK